MSSNKPLNYGLWGVELGPFSSRVKSNVFAEDGRVARAD